MDVYVVSFSTGEYEDKYSVSIKGYFKKEEAQRFVDKYNLLLIENNVHYKSRSEASKSYYIEELHLRTDYTGGKFWIEKLPCE